MRSDARLHRTRGTRAVLALSIGIAALACAVASCAESSGAKSGTPDGSTLPELDATSDADAAPDADCLGTGDDGGCALSCAEADFCVIPTGVDGRYMLVDVWGSSNHDVWAVGSGGTIIHWDGAAWTPLPLSVRDTLRGVGGSGASDVWIVSTADLVLHGTGFGTTAGFTRQPPIRRADGTIGKGPLSKVWAPNSGAVFVGGAAGLTGLLPGDSLWRFNVDFDADASTPAWKPVSTYSEVAPYLGIEGLWGTSVSDIWVVGADGLVRRSKGPVGDGGGEQWSTMETTLTVEDLHGIWGSSDSDVWIVGDHGTIRHWSGGTQHWSVVASPTTEDLRAVWGTGPSDAWAVGDGGTILHWDGTLWRSATTTLPASSKPRMSGVWGSGPSDVWVVGEAGALHFGGAKTASTPEQGGAR